MNIAWAGGITAKRSVGKVFNSDGTRVVHARSVAAEAAEVLVGERERWYGVEGAGRRRDEPTQANARGRKLDRSDTTGMDEVDANGVRAGKAVGSGAVEISGWLWEPGEEVGIAIGRAFAVF